jgi:hypothetical protein
MLDSRYVVTWVAGGHVDCCDVIGGYSMATPRDELQRDGIDTEPLSNAGQEETRSDEQGISNRPGDDDEDELVEEDDEEEADEEEEDSDLH